MNLTAKQHELATKLAPHISSDTAIHKEVERRHGKCSFEALRRVTEGARK